MDISIGSTELPDDAEELRSRLFAFNEERTGYHDGQALNCYLRDPDGRLVAGLDGFTWGGSTIVLDSHTFQAPGFYSALGFVEVGRTTSTPRGHDQVLMQLDLQA